MQSDMKRLLSFYKLVSVVGVCAVIAPAFYFLTLSIFQEKLTLLLTLLLFPATVSAGYLCQWLLLGKQERLKKQTVVDFNFEQKITIPKKQRRLAALLSIVVGALLGWLSSLPLSGLAWEELEALMAVYCAACAYIGVRLCRASFNQLLGIRSMIECFAAFALYALLGSYLVFFALALYSLCLLIELNQESVLQNARTSDTCRITPDILRTGIGLVFHAWGRAFLLALGLLSIYTTIGTSFYFLIGVTRFRLQMSEGTLSDFEIIFYDIPSRLPVLNCILFMLGIAIFIFAIVLLLGRRRQVGTVMLSAWRSWLNTLSVFLKKLLFGYHYRKKEKAIPAVPLTENYIDTVEKINRPVRRRALNYPSFLRRLRSLDGAEARFAYAYRTVIAFMVQKEIGVEAHHTPTEAAAIIDRKTNYREIGELTSLFTQMTYAKDRQIEGETLKRATDACCSILERIIST
ncbi:MAG: hypothetical protein IKJ35_01195 [Clostridia bacterium]|nr:hypothetical protein [Clostridia bacterium]